MAYIDGGGEEVAEKGQCKEKKIWGYRGQCHIKMVTISTVSGQGTGSDFCLEKIRKNKKIHLKKNKINKNCGRLRKKIASWETNSHRHTKWINRIILSHLNHNNIF